MGLNDAWFFFWKKSKCSNFPETIILKIDVKPDHRHQVVPYDGNRFLKESKSSQLQGNGIFVRENIEKKLKIIELA